MFRDILIETCSYCNRRCPDCPVCKYPREVEMHLDDFLFDRIVRELCSLGFSGRIGLHFFNEPLADDSIVEKVKKLRRYVPRSSIEINSNGDYLNLKLLRDLYESGLSKLFVTAYCKETFWRVKGLLDQCRGREGKIVTCREAPLFIGNRAGSLNNVVLHETLRANCFLPSYQIVVNYMGDVVLCCNDFYGRINFGNVSDRSLLEIWGGDKLRDIRKKLRKKMRCLIPICRSCNLFCDPWNRKYLTADEVKIYNHDRDQRSAIIMC